MSAAAAAAGLVLLAAVGACAGVVVGAAYVAFMNALRVPARLAALTYTRHMTRIYEAAMAAGAFLAAVWLVFPYTLRLAPAAAGFVGAAMGVYVGMLASALAETIGVIPVVARRTGLGTWVTRLIWFVVLGKITGSLIYWLYPPLVP
ncbi:MAG: stage V sporulation protein AB [Bacillota bacterium]|nr:stage V sporulation protein AB [Bacillota bacterium]